LGNTDLGRISEGRWTIAEGRSAMSANWLSGIRRAKGAARFGENRTCPLALEASGSEEQENMTP